MIIGCSGAGKSTLARQLGQVTGLPVIHLDGEYWKPGWTAPDTLEWLSRITALVNQPAWIIDGNYTRTLPLRIAAADTVVFFDFPRFLCMWRVISRSIFWYGRKRPDMADGCPERVDWGFLRYVWRWQRDSRPRALAALESFSGKLIVLRRPAEASLLIAKLQPQ
jgi:adenylate kinase family enzyme